MIIEPYLFLNGRAEEAMAFYERALGARIEVQMRFRESPDPIPEGRLPAGFEDKIMHASLAIGRARLMLSDGGCMDGPTPGGFALSLQCENDAQAHQVFEALAQGGRIDMPIGPTFWSPCFGMVTDRFGVQWMTTVAETAPH